MTEADLQAMQGQVAGFGSRLDKVDAFITAQTAAAPALAAKETALTEKLSTIEAAGVALKTSVDQVLAQIGGLTALKADLDAAKTELAGAKTELAATKTELAAVSGTVTAIQKARPQGQAEGDPPAPGGAAPAAGTPAPATRKFKGVFGMRL